MRETDGRTDDGAGVTFARTINFPASKRGRKKRFCKDAATGKNYHNVAKHSPSTKLRVGVAQTEDVFKNFPFIFPPTNHV